MRIRRTEDQWIEAYKKKDALWIHDGNVRRPHALLRSGLHSSGFFNSRRIIPDDALMRDAAHDLFTLFLQNGPRAVDGVVGPQTGATRLAEVLKDHIASFTGIERFHASPAKQGEGKTRAMVFSPEERELIRGKRVLLCEDVLTTGESVELTARAVKEAGGETVPRVLVLVNRSGLEHVNHRWIVSLITRSMPTWAPEDCPLCRRGSKAIEAKSTENWAELNAEYALATEAG